MQAKEWGVVVVVGGFFLSLIVIAAFSYSSFDTPQSFQPQPPSKIVITFEGAVLNEGPYFCVPGIELKELLKQVGLKVNADRKRIPFKKMLFASQTIKIAEKNTPSLNRKKNSLVEN